MLGIIYALGALFSWAFGDLFIQRKSRILGIWKALFFITFFGFVGLFPLIKDEIPILLQNTENLIWLLVAVVIVLFAALFDFEALKEGKFAVIEPILGIELPITVALSLFILKENISLSQGILIFLTFIGILLAVTTKIHHLKYHKRILEKGVIIAVAAAVAMALTNFIIGISSQKTSPIMA